MSASAASGRAVWPGPGRRSNTAGGSRHSGRSPATSPRPAATIARHTRSGVQGMSTWRTPRWARASTTALWTDGVEPIVPDSPMPLAPSGFRDVGVSVLAVSNNGKLGCARHGVVGQVRGQRVALRVEDHLLPQRLGHPLGDAAVLLALDEQRVEDPAAVVDRHVAPRPHLARLHVDLDHRDVGAEREGGPLLAEVDRRRQRPEPVVLGAMAAHLRYAARVRRPAGTAVDAGPCGPGSPGSQPSAARRSAARPASSAHERAPAGTPATPTRPPSWTTMSSTLASRWAAAISLARASTSSVAESTALPPICRDRDPPVPPPLGTAAVSDWTKRMSSSGMPSRSETIMAKEVAWPCPCAEVPTRMVAVPSRWISTDPNSLLPPPAVTST